MGRGKILLSQDLQQMPPRSVLFEVVIGQNFQLVFESHLQRPVAAGLKNRNGVERGLERVNKRTMVKALSRVRNVLGSSDIFVILFNIKQLRKFTAPFAAACQAKNVVSCRFLWFISKVVDLWHTQQKPNRTLLKKCICPG